MMGTFDPGEDRRPPITPQLALRIAVFGAVALGLFAVIFFRLWYLQVLSGDQYLAEANSNRSRELRIPAPRGEIVDRRGRELVVNKQAVVVQIDPSKLPDAERENAARWGQLAGRRNARPKGRRGEPVPYPEIPTAELAGRYRRLGQVLGKSGSAIHRQVIQALAIVPYAAVRVKTDVPRSVLSYIVERPDRFPGVKVERAYLRQYPRKKLAAQIFGTVGEINPDQIGSERYRGVKQGGIVGQSGLERTYDRYLRGTDGIQRVQVDAFGRPIPSAGLRSSDPVGGQTVKLSLDLEMQKTGQRALESLGGGNPGAFVAMDPRNGAVVAMGSAPSFDPSVLTKPLTKAQYDRIFPPKGDASPATNRAIASLYPTGSIFKPITAIAALKSGVTTPTTPFNDNGIFKIGNRTAFNAKKATNGTVTLPTALEVSSDTYFYNLGAKLFNQKGQPLQKWARRLGLDHTAGIDLPGEQPGLIPDRKYVERRNKREAKCRKRLKRPVCIALEIRPYNIGDNVNVAVGQGDVQATPLQMAVAYAAIANDGKVVRPHLGLEVQDEQGRLFQRIQRDPSRRVKFDDTNRQAVMDGLHLAATGPRGTSSQVFAGWPDGRLPIFGKTGTAERGTKGDQSWYVGFVKDEKRPLVVAATVEGGGFGAETAAPIVRLLMSQYYGIEKVVKKGTSTDR